MDPTFFFEDFTTKKRALFSLVRELCLICCFMVMGLYVSLWSLKIIFCHQEHGELQIRSDLLDCHVDVCSPEVLVQISDNFDYQDMRQDFVANEAANHELGNKILAHVVPDG